MSEMWHDYARRAADQSRAIAELNARRAAIEAAIQTAITVAMAPTLHLLAALVEIP